MLTKTLERKIERMTLCCINDLLGHEEKEKEECVNENERNKGIEKKRKKVNS